MFRSICNNFLYIGHNIIFNCYIFLFSIFPNYYKDTIINAKKTNDTYYNRMMFINFTDDIYNKYNIDLINIHSNIIKFINNKSSNNNNNDNSDNISVMSDISNSDISDISASSEFSDW
jgi:hypothetical protein